MNCLPAINTAKSGRCGEIKCNDFHIDLRYSIERQDDKTLDSFYLKTFPQANKVEFVKDLQQQKKGVDKIIYFPNNKTITIDEKKRRKDYGDILLELVSNDQKRTPGWLYYSQCDYIVYAILDAKKIYMLPVLLLQMAWVKNKSKWLKEYKQVAAKNEWYLTINIPIPTNVLLNSISEEMRGKHG